MPEKIYFYLLLLCGVLTQGIIGTSGDEIKQSSDILERQKRVVSYIPGEDVGISILNAPYLVIIRHRNRIFCVGNILSHHVFITISQCVSLSRSDYRVISGSYRTDMVNYPHLIIDIKRKVGAHPYRPADGIALVTVDPPFVFGPRTSSINLHSGLLLNGTLGTVRGWGFNTRCANRGTNIQFNLRSIQVQIMAHQDCVDIYRPFFDITEKDVCTYHPQRHCGDTDGGAPLVIQGELAGLRLWIQPSRDANNPQYPDVFVVLQDSEYNQWIRTNLRITEAHFQNRHN